MRDVSYAEARIVEEQARMEREKPGWDTFRHAIWATVFLGVGLAAFGTIYCTNRDSNADALALCLQKNSAVECAGLFDNVSVEEGN